MRRLKVPQGQVERPGLAAERLKAEPGAEDSGGITLGVGDQHRRVESGAALAASPMACTKSDVPSPRPCNGISIPSRDTRIAGTGARTELNLSKPWPSLYLEDTEPTQGKA